MAILFFPTLVFLNFILDFIFSCGKVTKWSKKNLAKNVVLRI